MSLLVGVLFFYAYVKVSRVTEDVVHNAKGVFDSLKYFWNDIDSLYSIDQKTEKSVFCNIIPRFRSFLCLSIGMLRKKYLLIRPPELVKVEISTVNELWSRVLWNITSFIEKQD